MARFTSDGKVKWSGRGIPGFRTAWAELNDAVSRDLPDLRARLLQVRGQNPGGGQTGHGKAWEKGWFQGRDNATAAVEKALGFPYGSFHPVPRAGTKEREGYDAAQAAALMAVLAIHPS